MLAESPNADPVKLCELAGYKNPAAAWKRIQANDAAAAQKAQEDETDKRSGQSSDAVLARVTLRKLAKSGPPTVRAGAAKALLESSPEPLDPSKDRCLVVFRGRSHDQGQMLQSNLDPKVLAAAIEIAVEQKEATEQAQLAEFSNRFSIDPDQMQMAWDLYSHQEARSAALRVYLLREDAET